MALTALSGARAVFMAALQLLDLARLTFCWRSCKHPAQHAALAGWIMYLAFVEKRRWLLCWSSIYAATGVLLTALTWWRQALTARGLSRAAAYCLASWKHAHGRLLQSVLLSAALGPDERHCRGPDPHDAFGCSLPFSLWLGALGTATLSYWTLDFMKAGGGDSSAASLEKHEQWVRTGCPSPACKCKATHTHTQLRRLPSLAGHTECSRLQVYDPAVGQYVQSQHINQFRVQ